MNQKQLFKCNFGLFRQSHRQENYFIETLSDEVTLMMIRIPGDRYMMGSSETDSQAYSNEQPQHQVKISSFYISQCLITQRQWKVVADFPAVDYPLEPNPSNFKGANRPVEGISWYEALEFCQRLSQQTGHYYRLPTEAEWEYVCRGSTTTPFHCGQILLPELANYNVSDSSLETSKKVEQGTTSVGSFRATNRFGLFDLHGNVYEWCLDHWHDDYHGAPTDGSPWLSNDKYAPRVIRGGFWLNYATHCRSAYRNFICPETHSSAIGFRVVCSAWYD